MNSTIDDEKARQQALERLQVLDTPDEQAYDDITSLAADLCGTPMALISLTDNHRQWFKSRVGLQAREMPRENSFCSHALETSPGLLIIENALLDARFTGHPLVVGEPKIRFYAGAPLLTREGHLLGALCVIDTIPRHLEIQQLEELQFMAQQVMIMLDSRPAPQLPAPQR
jgi:GAF domain-containing protein